MDHTNTIEECNSLIRSELAAISAYEQVLRVLDLEQECRLLEEIKSDHVHSVSVLESCIDSLGGVPVSKEEGSPLFADHTENADKSSIISAVEAIGYGEQQSEKLFEAAVEQDHLNDEVRVMVANELLPTQRTHSERVKKVQSLLTKQLKSEDASNDEDRKLDEALKGSFPASDPISMGR